MNQAPAHIRAITHIFTYPGIKPNRNPNPNPFTNTNPKPKPKPNVIRAQLHATGMTIRRQTDQNSEQEVLPYRIEG